MCKCVYRCADCALLSEGCIRVACRRGHRTTVVLRKKEKKPQSHQNQNFLIEMERTRGKGEGRRVGERGVWNRRQEHGRIGGGQRGRSVVGWKRLHAHRDINTHNTQTPTPPLHCSFRTDDPSPTLRCLSAPPKLVPMDFSISVLQQWANYNQAPSPN